jgi:ribosomal protein L11 methyltransferase
VKQLNLRTPLEGILPFSELIEEKGASSISAFEDETDHNFYIIKALFDCEALNLEKELERTSKKISIPLPKIYWQKPEQNQDWVTQTQKNFPPIQVGTFFIHGSHISKQESQHKDLIPIQVDAATAFGTGEHETTQGCLQLLTDLHKQKVTLKHALDMGCGTGILAIAAAKLWTNLPIHCIDIDPLSVEQAERNAQINQAFDHITVQQGDSPTLGEQGTPFDLVMANILANPLKALAPKIACATHKEKARLILSGLLTRQKEEVLEIYSTLGFCLTKSIEKNEWSSLLLERSPHSV